jgi:hypothetical protein
MQGSWTRAARWIVLVALFGTLVALASGERGADAFDGALLFGGAAFLLLGLNGSLRDRRARGVASPRQRWVADHLGLLSIAVAALAALGLFIWQLIAVSTAAALIFAAVAAVMLSLAGLLHRRVG